MKFEDFKTLFWAGGGLSGAQCRAHLGVSARTWARWRRGAVPGWAVAVIRARFEVQADGWHGWRFVGGDLVSPEGGRYSPGDVRALTLLRALHAAVSGARRSAGLPPIKNQRGQQSRGGPK